MTKYFSLVIAILLILPFSCSKKTDDSNNKDSTETVNEDDAIDISKIEKVIRVATLIEYAPFVFKKPSSNESSADNQKIISPLEDSDIIQGYSWDVVRESYHSQGYTIILNVRSWAGCLSMLDNSQIDAVFPATVSAERMDKYSFSKDNVNSCNIILYYNIADEKHLVNYSDTKDLKIGCINSWAFSDKLFSNKNNTFITINEAVEVGFNLLEKNRIDALAAYDAPFEYELIRISKTDKFSRSKVIDTINDKMMAGKNEKSRELLKVFDEGKKAIRDNGKLAEIDKKWGVYFTLVN